MPAGTLPGICRRLLALLVLAALALGVLTSCASSGRANKLIPPSTAPPPTHTSTPNTSNMPGDIMSSETITAPELHGTLLRVTYASQSLRGDPITVSGLIAYPNGDAPPDGRPIISWAHGTTGSADACAPSRDPHSFAGLAGLVNTLLDQNTVVTATDYEGLGTPGPHPYLVGDSEGRGVLDIARAALHVTDAHARPDVVIWGHSQGGHAALFAQQIASRWAPELHVLGAAAAAPAAELSLLAKEVDNPRYATFIVLIAAGFSAVYPELDGHEILSDQALDRIGAVEEECSVGLVFRYLDLRPSDMLKTDPLSVPSWATRLAENDPGNVRTPTPLLIYQGTDDELIPVATSEELLHRLCGVGQTAERRVYPGENHSSVLRAGFGDVIQWIDDRIAAKPAASSCMPS